MLLLNRKSIRVEECVTNLKEEKEKSSTVTEIVPVECDLSSFASVKQAAVEVNELCKKFQGLHVLANNAGIVGWNDIRTKDGFEVMMQTNHLSHFLLTKLLMPSIESTIATGKEVRICQHSSMSRNNVKAVKEVYFEKTKEGGLGGNFFIQKDKRYSHSKVANVCFALMLHKKLAERGVNTDLLKSVVAEPGVSATKAIDNMKAVQSYYLSKLWVDFVSLLLRKLLGMQSAADGALPLVQACFGENVHGGDFFRPEQEATGKPYKAIEKGELVKGNSVKETNCLSVDNQELVWKKSEEAVGEFFASS